MTSEATGSSTERREPEIVQALAERARDVAERNDLPLWRALSTCLQGAAASGLGRPKVGGPGKGTLLVAFRTALHRHSGEGYPPREWLWREWTMPLFMDRHDVPWATAKDVADAHLRDLEVSKKYSVQFLAYWFDQEGGGVFCFAKAPSREVLEVVHRESHGLIPNEVIGVAEDDVLRFLGRIHETMDPAELESPTRTILFTDLEGSTSILDSIGETAFLSLLAEHDTIIRRSLLKSHGREVKHTGDGIMAAFNDVTSALDSATEIQRGFRERPTAEGQPVLKVRIGIAAGRPVDHNDDIYGTAVVQASRICDSARGGHTLVSGLVRQMAEGSGYHFVERGPHMLRGFAQPVMVYELLTPDAALAAQWAEEPADLSEPAQTPTVDDSATEGFGAEPRRGRLQRWVASTLGRR